MITGDHAETARSIAAEAGIANGDVMTGPDLDVLDDIQLAERLNTITVFARIMPEQKLRIVKAFKSNGEIVAMTGDGVNDAPSLKAAHIGIAMGKRGTDVAREASAIVLLDDEFESIVHAIRLGRRIYDNLRKAMVFIIAVHVPIAGLALLPLILGLPILLGPVHIALIEMVIDPICALVFEAELEEDDIMTRPPRNPSEVLLSSSMVIWSVYQGILAFGMLAIMFIFEIKIGIPELEIRAQIFFAIVSEVFALVLVNRSFGASFRHVLVWRNKALHKIAIAITGVTALILFLPSAQIVLKFGSIAWSDVGLALGLGALLFVLVEGSKPAFRRLTVDFTRHRKRPSEVPP